MQEGLCFRFYAIFGRKDLEIIDETDLLGLRVVTLDGDIVDSVYFYGGCPGNLLGITALVKGRSRAEVVELLKGTRCGRRESSCPDQLARALESIK